MTGLVRLAAMSQVVLALDVVTGLVGLGAGANAPTVSAQATVATVNHSESYQPMLYTFVNATCYGSGTFKCVASQISWQYLYVYQSLLWNSVGHLVPKVVLC